MAKPFGLVSISLVVIMLNGCSPAPIKNQKNESIETFKSGDQKYNYLSLALKKKMSESNKNIFINVKDIENITNSPQLQSNFAYIATTILTELQTTSKFTNCQNCLPEVIDVFEKTHSFKAYSLNGVLASSDEKGRDTESLSTKLSASAASTSLFGGVDKQTSKETYQLEAALFLTGRYGESKAGLVVNNFIETGTTTEDVEYYFLVGGTGRERTQAKMRSQGLQYSANMLIKFSLLELIGKLYDFDYDQAEAAYYASIHSHVEKPSYSKNGLDKFMRYLNVQ